MSVYQATVLYYKYGETRPLERNFVDLKIKEEEVNDLQGFKRRLLHDECLGERSQQHTFSRFTVRVGYCERTTSKTASQPPSLGVFVESMTNEQFELCMVKLQNNSSFQLTIKVVENKPFFSDKKTEETKTVSNSNSYSQSNSNQR